MSSYTQVQAENFAKHETTAEDWEVCEFDGFLNGRPNYKRRFPQVQGWSFGLELVPLRNDGLHCELCGHPIVYDHYIECEEKELTMLVGSDCVNSFKGAHFSEKLEKVYREEQTRKMFDEWFPKAWVEFNSKNRRMFMYGKTYTYYKELRNIQRHYEGWTGTYNVTNPSELTTRKLLGIMKRGMREELTVPDLYFKIIEKRPLPRKKEESK